MYKHIHMDQCRPWIDSVTFAGWPLLYFSPYLVFFFFTLVIPFSLIWVGFIIFSHTKRAGDMQMVKWGLIRVLTPNCMPKSWNNAKKRTTYFAFNLHQHSLTNKDWMESKKCFFLGARKGAILIKPGTLYIGLVKDYIRGSFDFIQSFEFHEHKLAEIRAHKEISIS